MGCSSLSLFPGVCVWCVRCVWCVCYSFCVPCVLLLSESARLGDAPFFSRHKA